MSTMNLDVVHSRRVLSRNAIARQLATFSTRAERRDLAVVVVFCAVGMLASLAVMLLHPDGAAVFAALP